MRCLVQRVTNCEVWIDGRMYGNIGKGLLVFFGTQTGDREELCVYLADKVVNLRVFEDADEKMNLSTLDVSGEIMIVSQFTLYSDTRKGRRPAFTSAMEPVEAERLYNRFVDLVTQSGLTTRTGQFGAKMEVRLTNSGPVTIMLEHDVPGHS